jgi:hypothetical protein
MKLGGENKKALVAACGLGLVAVLLLGHLIFAGPKAPAPPVAAPVSAPSTQASVPPAPVPAPKSGRSAPAAAVGIPDLSLHLAQLQESQSVVYTPKGRDLFESQAMLAPVALPKIVRSPLKKNAAPVAAAPRTPQQTPAPPIPLKFFGQVSGKGAAMKAMLSHGGTVYVVSPGEVVEGRYKILSVSPTAVEAEDLFYSYRQMLALARN